MIVRSLGYRTDLFFPAFDGEIIDRGDYLVVRTPANPTYHWGNFLLFSNPPQEGDWDRWRDLFKQEIGPWPQVGHVALGWDGVDGAQGLIDPFLAEGYALEDSIVLTAQAVVRPAKYNEEVEIRPLAGGAEWQAVIENQVVTRDEQYSETGYRTYTTQKMARFQAMVAAGLGHWFGAFLNERLVADLGVFVKDGVGRFQTVGTHPDYRRRGICGAMVHQAAEFAYKSLGAKTLVMVADPEYHAAKIYESIGFKPVERYCGITWFKD